MEFLNALETMAAYAKILIAISRPPKALRSVSHAGTPLMFFCTASSCARSALVPVMSHASSPFTVLISAG